MNKYTTIERRTKEVYIEQHKNFGKDASIFERHLKMAQQLETYDLPAEFFKNATIIDAGCGNTGYFEVAMFNLGAKHVVCLDIGDEWMSELRAVLQAREIPDSFYTLVEGSAIDLPFPDGSFDFACSYGVIMHLESPERARRAIAELARVTAPGGAVYAHIGIDNPGIVDRYIVKALRAAYQEDEEFRHFIDTLNPDLLAEELSFIYKQCEQYDSTLKILTKEFIRNLITLDTTTFFQNMIQVPVQQASILSESWGVEQFSKCGLENIRRPRGAFWARNDFRRYLSPIHFMAATSLSGLFYGNGHVKLTGVKPSENK